MSLALVSIDSKVRQLGELLPQYDWVPKGGTIRGGFSFDIVQTGWRIEFLIRYMESFNLRLDTAVTLHRGTTTCDATFTRWSDLVASLMQLSQLSKAGPLIKERPHGPNTF